ncbi:MAG: hypothetical protein ABSF35_20980 [Polyangia bacterium]
MDLLAPFLGEYKSLLPAFAPGVHLYRGRVCRRPVRLGDISYPPLHLVRQLGRINDIGQSIFYAATTRSVPFFELSCRPDETLALAVWKTTDRMTLNHIGYTADNSRRLLSRRALDQVYDFTAGLSRDDLGNSIRDYLAAQFSQVVPAGAEYRYKISIAIARGLLAPSNVDGLLYPTIAMSGNADNVALKPTFVDSSCRFMSVEFLSITSESATTRAFRVIDSATHVALDGMLDWSGRALKWSASSARDLVFRVEADSWVAYDRHGNRVDPD